MARTDFRIGQKIELPQLWNFVASNQKLELHPAQAEKVQACRDYLDAKIESADQPIYGINTGFGSLYNISIDGQDLSALQENLVRSHACGTGPEVEYEVRKFMLVLKVQSLSLGHSGISLEVLQRLIDFYNADCIPVVYEQGSLGASGDLAPLAHLSLPLMGEGEVDLKGKRMPAQQALQKLGMEPLKLRSKEGLALLNGTQFMSAFASVLLRRLYVMDYLADLIASLSLEAYDGRKDPFEPFLHDIRPHFGQRQTAARVRQFLKDSALIERAKSHVQDPYSFRCIPQVHGSTKDAMRYIWQTVETEVNSVTDNPTIFPEEDRIISGGNFHGQCLALSLDMMAIAAAELANISERRTYLLLSGNRSLPPFLVAKPGLNSGLMIAQYTAASIVSQNKQLCTPASVDSIVSSNGQEDHVSMGANAATKAARVLENLETVLAIELISASQALYFREDASSPFLTEFVEAFRAEVPFIDRDRILSRDIAIAKSFLRELDVEEEELLNASR